MEKGTLQIALNYMSGWPISHSLTFILHGPANGAQHHGWIFPSQKLLLRQVQGGTGATLMGLVIPNTQSQILEEMETSQDLNNAYPSIGSQTTS